jgi:DNA-binding MarR family transcriptional regulator
LTTVKPSGKFEQVKRLDVDGAELRSIMRAWSRQQLAFSDETMHFFMDVDLTMSQFRALVMIRRWGPQTGRELARRLHVTPGSLVPLVDRLEEQGYLRRVPDMEDRRLTWLELTPKADRLFRRLWGVGAARIAAAIARLVPKDRAELRRILTHVAEHLEAAGAEKTGAETASG